jgi:hypothetical protein
LFSFYRPGRGFQSLRETTNPKGFIEKDLFFFEPVFNFITNKFISHGVQDIYSG